MSRSLNLTNTDSTTDLLNSFLEDRPEGMTRDDLRQMEECALDLLYSLLARVPKEDDLAEYLHSNPIPTRLKYSTGVRLQSTIFAVQVYIEVIDFHLDYCA